MKVSVFSIALALIASAGTLSQAATTPAAAHPAAPVAAQAANDGLTPYEKFTDGRTAQHGLFTIWRSKEGDIALELRPDQFNQDFVELGVPVNGVGDGLFSGITDLQNCRILRFVHTDNRVAILFPTTRFLARPNSPEEAAVQAGTASSVAGVAKVLSVDKATGNVVFDASPFLQDITDVADFLTLLNGGHTINPMGSYRFDAQQSYFGKTKSFPDNAVITANQTFSTLNAQYMDNVPDGRNIQIALQYDIAAIPPDDRYMPRFYDDRVGYFVNAHADFSSDDSFNKDANYIVRWNITLSHPVVYYLSNTIPTRYRAPIRKALLTWNNAFARIGLPNAVQVKDQPNDPSFDPDDIRYNVVRWLTENHDGGFAEAQLLYNPYTGEMIKSGIVIDSDLMRYGKFDYPVEVGTGATSPRAAMLGEVEYARGEREQFGFGMTALAIAGAANGYAIPEKFADQFLDSIVLHESGHDFGLRHNFIGSEAYSAKELQDPVFTARHGVSSSVMEYSPINIWPKGTRQGQYFQTALGPYDYYAIKWGYAPVAGARSPQDELPTLHRWASLWKNPTYAWSSDEDVSWYNGAGVDPRNQQWDLTNDNIGWCGAQMTMAQNLLRTVDRRFPRAQGSYDDLQTAFAMLLGKSESCSEILGRYIGGEYVSRSLRGDGTATLPLSAVPMATEARAFKVLESNVFSANAWNFSPRLLREMVTQYRYDDWDGNLPLRHDLAIEDYANFTQMITLARMFDPVTLQRLDDMSFKYGTGHTMDIGDLFTWMQSAVYGDVSHPKGGDIPLVRRDLQRSYAAMLSRLANSPRPGTPPDAQALARYELGALRTQLGASLRANRLDLLTRAHLAALNADVSRALNAQMVLAAPRM